MKREKHNLSTLNIKEFDESNTIYIRDKNGFNKPLHLCQFVSFDEKKREVTGTIINGDADKGVVATTGETLVNKLSQCALYGEAVENSGRSFYHWFDSVGYAMHPMEEYKIVENEMHCSVHPSYGLVSLCRQSSSGGKTLFGSSIQHGQTISLTIKRATHDRSLNNDWIYGKDEIIEVELSQTQFAELITSFNMGSGTPCTIRHIEHKRMPDPHYKSKVDIHNQEFKAAMHNLGVDIEKSAAVALDILKNKPNINKGDRELILSSVNSLIQSVKSSIPFMSEQFAEQMDKTITEAKGEIEAFVENKIRTTGLEAIAAGADFPKVKELTESLTTKK